MGSSPSKAATAARRGGAARRFPAGASDASLPHRAPGPMPPRLGDSSTETGQSTTALGADAQDPDLGSGDFSQRLRQMGMVRPSPTFSPSSRAATRASRTGSRTGAAVPVFPSAHNNATLSVLDARRAVQQRADDELDAMGRPGPRARRFLDMRTAVDAVQLRDGGMPPPDVEKRLRLEPGIMVRLGRHGVLTHVSTSSRR